MSEDWRQKDPVHVLYLLHNDVWCEELISGPFDYVYRALSVRMRQIVELKVQGEKDLDICKLFSLSAPTYSRVLWLLKRRYRHGIETRVDNLKPEWMVHYRSKRKKERKEHGNQTDHGSGF